MSEKVQAAPAASPARVSLDDFCRDFSMAERRVEAIAGFHSSEVLAGHMQDTAAAFSARFNDFMNKPVS